jgi:D-sedoheptulose 7-phosphate isomerase
MANEKEACMEFAVQIDNYFSKVKTTIDCLDRSEITQFLELLVEAYQRDASIFIFGNGGSAATASHFACDTNKGIGYGLKKRFRVFPLADSVATMTAYANDVGYEDVFVEQLKNFLNDGDLVIGISGSGNSQNVIKAIEYANDKGNITIGITVYDCGKLRAMAHYSVNTNINDMQISEDIHMMLTNLTMQLLRNFLHQQ